MENFQKIKNEIIHQLVVCQYDGDLSDIGNEIGIVIGQHLDDENTLNDFIMGLKHGISLADGTHP